MEECWLGSVCDLLPYLHCFIETLLVTVQTHTYSFKMSEWSNEWGRELWEWMGEELIKWENKWLGEWVSEQWLCERTAFERVSKLVSEDSDDWGGEWVTEWVKDWLYEYGICVQMTVYCTGVSEHVWLNELSFESVIIKIKWASAWVIKWLRAIEWVRKWRNEKVNKRERER